MCVIVREIYVLYVYWVNKHEEGWKSSIRGFSPTYSSVSEVITKVRIAQDVGFLKNLNIS